MNSFAGYKKLSAILAVTLSFCILLTSCAGGDAIATGGNTAATADSEATKENIPKAGEITDEQVLAAYRKAFEAYNWFDLEPLPHTEESVQYDGLPYFKVKYAGITKRTELAAYLKTIFAPSIVSNLLSGENNLPGLKVRHNISYIDNGGALYVLEFIRRKSQYKGEEHYSISRESDAKIILTVTVDILDRKDFRSVIDTKDFTFSYELVSGKWLFTAFGPTDDFDGLAVNIEHEGSFSEMLKNITPKEICKIDANSITAEELAPLLNKAPDQLIDHEPLYNGGWGWLLFVYLDSTFGSDNSIHLYVGFEENIVEISFRGDKIHCNSPELYRLVRSAYDVEPFIDKSALAGLKTILDERMKSTLAHFSKQFPEAGFYGYEMDRLRIKSTFDDIIDGKVYVYEFYYALLMKHPEHSPLIGGEVIDSKLRLRGFDEEPYLLVAEINGEIKYTKFMFFDLYFGAEKDEETNARKKITLTIGEWLADK